MRTQALCGVRGVFWLGILILAFASPSICFNWGFDLYVLEEMDLHLGSMNIRDFGNSKASKDSVMEILADIAIRYDLLFVQELSWKPNNACGLYTSHVVCEYIGRLNNKTIERALPYRYGLAISERVGASSKEQYFAVYDTSRLELEENFVYPNVSSAVFERPPQVASFRLLPSQRRLWVVNIHTKPVDAAPEVLGLAQVARYIVENFGGENIAMLGDFNADGDDFKLSDWPPFYSALSNLTLEHFPRAASFEWHDLIKNGWDTTVATGNSYTYDRIVVSPQLYPSCRSSKVFYWDNMTDGGFSMQPVYDEGCSEGWYDCGDPVEDANGYVSDHYLVEANLTVSYYRLRQLSDSAPKLSLTVVAALIAFIF